MLTEKTLTTDGVSIHYAEGPPSGAPLVLIHGITGRWQELFGVMSVLALRYHLFAVDLRGHGDSSRAPGAYGVPDDAGDIAALLRERVGAPAVLAGHSLGGLVAAATAARAPEWVTAAVLVDPPLAVFTAGGSSVDGFIQMFRAWREIMTSGGSDADKVAALTALTPAADPLTLHRRFALLQRCDPEVLTWAIEHRLAGGLRLETLFPQIACPVLLIQCNPALGGALDDRLAQAAATYLPNCVHLYMPDVGHSIHREQPITLAQRVTDFIETIHG